MIGFDQKALPCSLIKIELRVTAQIKKLAQKVNLKANFIQFQAYSGFMGISCCVYRLFFLYLRINVTKLVNLTLIL